MLLSLGGTYVLIVTLLVACALRAKDLAASDGVRFHEDLEQMRAMRPRGPAPTGLVGMWSARLHRR
jgi:hypothetical protein